MNDSTATALGLAAGLCALGLATGAVQVVGRRRLAARKYVPSDEHAYLRGRYRRRLLTAGVLVVLGGMIGGAYLSGMEARADALGEPRPRAGPDAPRPEPTAEQKAFVRQYGLYWIGVLVLTFALVGLALADALATRKYWLDQYRRLRDEHHARLRRDLAAHQAQARGRRLR